MKLPQLSLRELFLLVALAAMGCGWWVREGQHKRQQQEYLSNLGLLQTSLSDIGRVADSLKRTLEDSVVPPHENRESFLGDWRVGNENEFYIAENAGKVYIDLNPKPDCVLVATNVHWDNDRLCFDMSEHFTYPGRKSNKKEVALTLTKDAQRLKRTMRAGAGAEVVEDELVRVVDEKP